MKNGVIALALAAASLTASAADWQFIEGNKDGFTAMDFASITTAGPYTKVWVQENYLQPKRQNASVAYQSVNILFYFDCLRRTSGIVQLAAYDKAGAEGRRILAKTLPFSPGQMNDVVPDTEGERMLRVACATQAAREKLKGKSVLAIDGLVSVINAGGR